MAIRDFIPWGRDESVPATYRDDPFMAFRREMDRLFDDVFRSPEVGRLRSHISGTWPRVEVTDNENEIHVTAEMPGMDEKDIDVSFDDGVMILKGEKREDTESKDRRFTERYYGRFERRIPVGTEVQEDKISAKFKNGVLHVVMPKTERAQSRVRRISIEGESGPRQ